MPNALARNFARSTTDCIGIVVPGIANPYYAVMVETIDRAAREHGLRTLLGLLGGEARRDEVIEDFRSRRADGLIVCAGAADHQSGRTLEALWMMRPAEPPASMRTLAALMNYDPSTMTFVADKLEAKGLIVRRVDPQNRRVKLLELTDKGRDARALLLLSLADRLPAKHLSVDEQRELFRLLSKGLTLSKAARDGCN